MISCLKCCLPKVCQIVASLIKEVDFMSTEKTPTIEKVLHDPSEYSAEAIDIVGQKLEDGSTIMVVKTVCSLFLSSLVLNILLSTGK